MKAYTNDIEDITIQYTITYCNCKLTTLGRSTSMAELLVECYSFTALFVSITSASTNLMWLESLTYGQSIAASCLLFMEEIKQMYHFSTDSGLFCHVDFEF